jgi:hypothetical protein
MRRRKMKVKMTPVVSGAVKSVGYGEGLGIVTEYKNGAKYHLSGTTKQDLERLLKAESVGKTLAEIKANFGEFKLGDEVELEY